MEEAIIKTNLEAIIAAVVGFVFGVVIGYIVALRSKKPESKVTAVQLLAVATLFGYLIVSFAYGREVSWVIAVAILATGYGMKGGEILESILEKRK